MVRFLTYYNLEAFLGSRASVTSVSYETSSSLLRINETTDLPIISPYKLKPGQPTARIT